MSPAEAEEIYDQMTPKTYEKAMLAQVSLIDAMDASVVEATDAVVPAKAVDPLEVTDPKEQRKIIKERRAKLGEVRLNRKKNDLLDLCDEPDRRVQEDLTNEEKEKIKKTAGKMFPKQEGKVKSTTAPV